MKIRLAAAGLAAAAVLAGCTGANSAPANTSTAPTTAAAPATSATPTPTPTPTPSASKPATPAALVPLVQQAVQQATSVHLKATGTANGTSGNVEATGTIDGTATKLNVQISGAQVEVLRVASKLYLKGDDAFWNRILPGQGATYAGKYVDVTSNPQVSKTVTSFQLKSIIDQLSQQFGQATWQDGVASESINGKQTWVITATDGSKVWVAADGTNLPVQAQQKNGTLITFDQWNSAPAQTAPPADQVVTLG